MDFFFDIKIWSDVECVKCQEDWIVQMKSMIKLRWHRFKKLNLLDAMEHLDSGIKLFFTYLNQAVAL